MVQDNTDNNIQDLKNQLEAERQKEAQQAAAAQAAVMTPPWRLLRPRRRLWRLPMAPRASQRLVFPDNPARRWLSAGWQLWTAGRERSRAFSGATVGSATRRKERESVRIALFLESCLQSSADQHAAQPQPPQGCHAHRLCSPALAPPATQVWLRHAPPGTSQRAPKRAPEVNIDSASGQPYVLYEGITLDTVLMNRLDGDAVGPVKVLVSNPVYSHDHQHVLIPDGTIVLGEAKKIGSSGFGSSAAWPSFPPDDYARWLQC